MLDLVAMGTTLRWICVIGLVVCVSAGVVVDSYEDEGSANGPPTTSIVPQLIIGMVRMIVLGNVVIYDQWCNINTTTAIATVLKRLDCNLYDLCLLFYSEHCLTLRSCARMEPYWITRVYADDRWGDEVQIYSSLNQPNNVSQSRSSQSLWIYSKCLFNYNTLRQSDAIKLNLLSSIDHTRVRIFSSMPTSMTNVCKVATMDSFVVGVGFFHSIAVISVPPLKFWMDYDWSCNLVLVKP